MIGLELLLRLQELGKALAQKANLWMYFDHENEGPPLFSDRTRRTFCPQCEQRLKVQKTRIRNGRFLNIGAIQVKTTYMVCSHCKPQVVVPPELVTSLLPKFATLGLEVTVWIGLERFHKRRRIVDIQYELEGRGISVCENTRSVGPTSRARRWPRCG